jgi:uncharacterized protein YndB with AHSA1/START domain
MMDKFNPELDLKLERVVENVKPETIWKAWTRPEHLKRWFVPEPWTIADVEVDLRPGGIFRTVMQSPEGQQFPNLGCFLEIVENKKLVWTDLLLPGFRPAATVQSGADLQFTATILIEAHGKGSRYTAIVMHKNVEDRKRHEEMGFQEGWGKCFDQLVALAPQIQ